MAHIAEETWKSMDKFVTSLNQTKNCRQCNRAFGCEIASFSDANDRRKLLEQGACGKQANSDVPCRALSNDSKRLQILEPINNGKLMLLVFL